MGIRIFSSAATHYVPCEQMDKHIQRIAGIHGIRVLAVMRSASLVLAAFFSASSSLEAATANPHKTLFALVSDVGSTAFSAAVHDDPAAFTRAAGLPAARLLVPASGRPVWRSSGFFLGDRTAVASVDFLPGWSGLLTQVRINIEPGQCVDPESVVSALRSTSSGQSPAPAPGSKGPAVLRSSIGGTFQGNGVSVGFTQAYPLDRDPRCIDSVRII